MRVAAYFILCLLALLLCIFVSLIAGNILAGIVVLFGGPALDPMFFVGFMTASVFAPFRHSIRQFIVESWGPV